MDQERAAAGSAAPAPRKWQSDDERAPERGAHTLVRWVAACAAAEAIGMTAAVAAALLVDELYPFPRSTASAIGALLVVVAGGIVEGLALGSLQQAALARRLPALRRRTWLITTVLVAGLGWAAASAPGQLTSSPGEEPLAGTVLVFGAALGIGMGALLGAAQALALRGAVSRPARWIAVSAIAWTPAMTIIFAGATAPGEGWPPFATLSLALATGAAAGTVLGLVSGVLWPVLESRSWSGALVAGALRSDLGSPLRRALTLLRVRGTVTGRLHEFPVQYARDGSSIVVVPARPEGKRWWRNLRRPSGVGVFLEGRWRRGRGRTLETGAAGYADALAVYRRRWPRVPIPEGGFPVVVLIELLEESRTPTLSDPPS